MGKIFVCNSCKCGFNYPIEKGTDKECDHCGKSVLKQLENWETFTCPQCGKSLEVLQLEMMAGGIITYTDDALDDRFRVRGEITEGKVNIGEIVCPEDGTILQWDMDSEDDISLNKEYTEDMDAWNEIFNEDFEEAKRKMQNLESIILGAAGLGPKISDEPKTRGESRRLTRSSVLKTISSIPDSMPSAQTESEISSSLDILKDSTISKETSVAKAESPFASESSKVNVLETSADSISAKRSPFAKLEAAVTDSSQSKTKPLLESSIESSKSSPALDLVSSTETKDTLSESEKPQPIGLKASEIPLTSEEISIETVEVSILGLIIPKITKDTPFADEFWEYYFNGLQEKESGSYLGGVQAVEKIKGLLNEVNSHILNPTLIDVTKPFEEEIPDGNLFVIGDTHGSFADTEKIIKNMVQNIEKISNPLDGESINPPLRIVFAGDYVDRSPLDIHNLLYILCFTVKYAPYVRLLRGNHEEVTINKHYGFEKNVSMFLGKSEIFELIQDVFANLPLMYVLNVKGNRLLVLHGGIPFYDFDPEEMPEIPHIFDEEFYLACQTDSVEEMDELSQQILWNDPAIDLPENTYYLPSRRGIGFNFGKEVFDEWMNTNKIDRLIRGHEVFLEGHAELFDDRLFSLFSSSNYVGREIEAKIIKFDFSKDWESDWSYLTIQKDL